MSTKSQFKINNLGVPVFDDGWFGAALDVDTGHWYSFECDEVNGDIIRDDKPHAIPVDAYNYARELFG